MPLNGVTAAFGSPYSTRADAWVNQGATPGGPSGNWVALQVLKVAAGTMISEETVPLKQESLTHKFKTIAMHISHGSIGIRNLAMDF